MAKNKEITFLRRDCMAMLVPSGSRIMIHKDTEVTITQALGDSFTVMIYGNLARIEGKDADALGKPAKNLLDDLPPETTLEDKIWILLRTVFDPEIPVNIVDLGLVYQCQIEQLDEQYKVNITMTLTAPGCGMGPVLIDEVKNKVLSLSEVADAEVELVFDPPWSQEMMSDVAKLELGVF